MAQAGRERAIVDAPKAVAMKEAIFAAVHKYMTYLNRAGMFYQDEHPDNSDYVPLTVSTALVVTAHPYLGIDISLKDGPLQRVFGLGVDPDPDGRNPPAPRTPASRRRRHELDPLDPT